MSKRNTERPKNIEKSPNPNEIPSFISQNEDSEINARPRRLQNLVNTHNSRRMRNSYPDAYSQPSSSNNQKISPQDQVRRLSSIIFEQRTSSEEFTNSPREIYNRNKFHINSATSENSSPEAPQIISSMARLRLDQTSKTEPPPTPQGLLRQLVRSIQTERLADTSSGQEIIRDNPNNPISQKPWEYSKQTAISDSSSESYSAINFDDIEKSAHIEQIDKFSNLVPIDLSSIHNIEELSNLNMNNQALRDISIDLPSTSNHMGFDLNTQNDLEDAQELMNKSLVFIGDDLELLFPRDALPTPEKKVINIFSELDVNNSSINTSFPLNNSLADRAELSPNNEFNLSKFDEVGPSYQNQQILDLSGSDIASIDADTNDHIDKKSADFANNISSSYKFGNGDEDDLSMLERAFIEASTNDRSDRSFGMDYLGEVDSDVDEKTQISVSEPTSKLDLEDAANDSEHSNENQMLIDSKAQPIAPADDINTEDGNYSIPEHEIEPEIEIKKLNTASLEKFDEFNSDLANLNMEPNFSTELNNGREHESKITTPNQVTESGGSIGEVDFDTSNKTTEPSLHSGIEKESENAVDPDDMVDQSVESESDQEPEIDTEPQEDLIKTPSVSSESPESSVLSDIEAITLQTDEQPEDEEEHDLPSEFEIIGTADISNLDIEAENHVIMEPSDPVDTNLDTGLIDEANNNEGLNVALSNNSDLMPSVDQEETLLSANSPISPETSFVNNPSDLNNENVAVGQEIDYSDLSEDSIDNTRMGISKPILSPISPGTAPTIHKLPAYTKQRKIDFNQVSRSTASLNNLPASQVKSLVESMTNSRISSATLNSFLFATDKYFEQVSGDLLAYSRHAQRKNVNEEDVLCLFKRQNKIKNAEMGDWISLAQKQLPRDLWEPLAQPVNPTKRRKTN